MHTLGTVWFDGYVRNREMTKALLVVTYMKQTVKPNEKTYTMLIDRFINSIEINERVGRERTEARCGDLHQQQSGGYIKKGKMAEALNVKNEMETRGLKPNQLTYMILIAKNRKLEEAYKLVKKWKGEESSTKLTRENDAK